MKRTITVPGQGKITVEPDKAGTQEISVALSATFEITGK